jgi:hypothetical protein
LFITGFFSRHGRKSFTKEKRKIDFALGWHGKFADAEIEFRFGMSSGCAESATAIGTDQK